ncbi:MAG: NAD-dependent epimerase/dehydratase family protein [Sphaerochaetaceae bacterium]|nr:NAD-dependent epimerase/dehydratase family protein [Sphaerochaetaceae bacterium]
MKKILVVGKGSYIGSSFADYMSRWPEQYSVDTLDTFGDGWKTFDYSGYDAIYQVAGIAHIKETEENKNLYYLVNRDLAVSVAKLAKEAGVKHFVYLSSMSIYGMNTGVITKETPISPVTNYGKSKVQAEEQLSALIDDSFVVSFLRPPMVYGKGCKGNYQSLEKFARKLPFFPYVKNERSMIYIDNLCEFVKQIIDKKLGGVFYPQNKEYIQTSKAVKMIATAHGKNIFLSRLMGFAVVVFRNKVEMLSKAFGSLVYKDTEDFEYSYCKVSFEESIEEMYRSDK